MRPSLTPLFLTGKKSCLVVSAYASCRKSSALPPDPFPESGRPAFLSEVLLLLLFAIYVPMSQNMGRFQYVNVLFSGGE